jgi:type I restriction enzyme, S subunit
MNTEYLPTGWKLAKLSDVTQMVMGQSPPSETYKELGRGLPFLEGKAEITELFPKPTKSCTMPLKIAKQGSVLISVRAPVGDVNLANQDYIIGRGLCSITIADGDNKFLFYSLLHSKDRIDAKGSGTTFRSINKATLDNFVILLPPTPEQRAIARALRAAQAAREARLRELSLERERKAALMEYLFTHGTRGEATKQTEIGEMPESWKVAALDEISSIVVPSRNKPKKLGGQYLWVAPADITQDCVYIHTSLNSLTKESAESVKNKLMQKDTVLLCCAGSTIGKTAILGISAYANQQFYGFISREQKLIPLYLYYVFKSMPHGYYRQLAGTTTLPFFSKGVASSILIPHPSLEEQKKIADSLFACDNIISALNFEVRLLEELFRAMLKELMSGRLSSRGIMESA